ncbi:hypothetical protein BDP27DRAFT_218438 [Rhodocollybia butyracea]|uniref:Uncharacterized protein n=1 Tax=Rhodocollybia butyracea TaxID=206335 RepID=A0A9P5Q3G2_9AGAR|nr:hypothetical protein BDP27DRAFT_218438 [Rhodocollybia butyracea]
MKTIVQYQDQFLLYDIDWLIFLLQDNLFYPFTQSNLVGVLWSLCSQNTGDHDIRNYRSWYDFQKHFLPPLRTSSLKPLLPLANRPKPGRRERTQRISRTVREELEESDRFECALAHRKWIYRHGLYAKTNQRSDSAYIYSMFLPLIPVSGHSRHPHQPSSLDLLEI